MSTYTNPAGSPAVEFNGRVEFSRAELATVCRAWGPKLNVPEGIDGARLLWAFAGRESSFGADCRPRHEAAYCIGKYSKHTDVVAAFKRWGHLAHCSLGPWQMLYVNEHTGCDPQLFAQLDFAAMRTVAFFNSEIFGRQKAQTLQQAADAWNSGNFRDSIVPTDYIAAIQRNYDLPMPVALQAGAVDANDVYQDLCDAIEGLGRGIHFGALSGVPVRVEVAGTLHELSGCDIQWVNDEHGKRVDRITLHAC